MCQDYKAIATAMDQVCLEINEAFIGSAERLTNVWDLMCPGIRHEYQSLYIHAGNALMKMMSFIATYREAFPEAGEPSDEVRKRAAVHADRIMKAAVAFEMRRERN